jgi:hypothetical protein
LKILWKVYLNSKPRLAPNFQFERIDIISDRLPNKIPAFQRLRKFHAIPGKEVNIDKSGWQTKSNGYHWLDRCRDAQAA